MTVEQIAIRLDNCATGKGCAICKYLNQTECETFLIKEMADECRKIVEKQEGEQNG